MNEPFAISRSSVVVGLLVAALSAMACSSSSGSGGGAGSGGAAGVDGGGSDSGASGAAGNDAGSASDATGAAGSDASTDAPAEAAPSAELNACGAPAKLGAALVRSQTVSLNFGDRSTTAMDGSVVWFGQLNMETMPQMLDVQLYKSAAPFGATLAPMTINLTGQNDFATCGACVLFHPKYNDGVEIRAQPNYIATSGTMTITAVPNGTATKLTATLSNVTFQHVMIDTSFKTTKLDDCTITLTSASIDANVTP